MLGADKKWGLRVYDLDGHEIQGMPLGRINNVDA
ncbi:MAG: phytase, partial [Pseudomonadota bacterium]